MATDKQVRKLFRFLDKGMSLAMAAARSGMDEKTARKYRKLGKLPTEVRQPHTWRTRSDPFESVWDEVVEQLELNPAIEAKSLFEWLQREHPGQFQDGQLRTFQRGVKRWRATHGPPKEVFFTQRHEPGALGASDFTHVSELDVTIQRQPFDHMLYHFVLTYSNWEWATICFSESFESLAEGLQRSLGELGGAPARHRTDRLSSAVNNLSDTKEFTTRYRELMQHLNMREEKIQAGQANENGDVESMHGHLKRALDQALMLRGSRDFESREDYERFLRTVLVQKNQGRAERLKEERPHLTPLPSHPHPTFKRIDVRVNQGSIIRVQGNAYSVESRLIGERVTVRIYAEYLEIWYAQKCVDKMPRLRGRNKSHINYRHIVDSLVRKPGAFENYCYRDDLFPTTHFRIAYDYLREHSPSRASREYVEILWLAARENESAVDDALRCLLAADEGVSCEAVKASLKLKERPALATDVEVEVNDLNHFDFLYETKDTWYGHEHGCEGTVN